MRVMVMAMVMALPSAVLAGDMVFDCVAPGAAYPEMTAHLTKYYLENRGRIAFDGVELEVDVLSGLGTLTFLYLGDDFSMSYNVHPRTGRYNYSASGTKSGYGQGVCTQINS